MSKEKINMLDLIVCVHIISFALNKENEGKKLDMYIEGDKLIIKKSDIKEGEFN